MDDRTREIAEQTAETEPERIGRVHSVEDARVEYAGKLETERVARANQLLEQRVRRETIVDSRLDSHEARLAQINGQLVRGAKATELVAERLQTLTTSVVDLRGEIHTKGEVKAAIETDLERRRREGVTKRELIFASLTVTISLAGFGSGFLAILGVI